MKEFTFNASELSNVHDFDGNLLQIDQAAAFLALRDSGYFDQSKCWNDYESKVVANPVECSFSDYFNPKNTNYFGSEICDEYYKLYDGTKCEPFTRETAENLPDGTPLTFYPDEKKWSRTNNDYSSVCSYYGINVMIKVC